MYKTKTAARHQAIAARKQLDERCRQKQDKAIANLVLQSSAWKSAREIYTYCSMAYEVDTYYVIQAGLEMGKTVAVPCCTDRPGEMIWRRLDSLDQLIHGRFNIMEPDPNLSPEVLDTSGSAESLALVPGLIFDSLGYRLGYGAGYYDRFLSQFKGISFGLAYRVQMRDSLAALGLLDTYDRKCSHIVYEGGYDRDLLR